MASTSDESGASDEEFDGNSDISDDEFDGLLLIGIPMISDVQECAIQVRKASEVEVTKW